MSKAGGLRFPGNLNPRAQEFVPRNPTNTNPPVFAPLHDVFYAYGPPGHGLPMPYLQNDLRLLPFLLPPLPAYVGVAHPNPPQAAEPPLPLHSASPTRAVVLSSVPPDITETDVRRAMEVYGDVRCVQMERAQLDGIVTVHFYDLRHAEKAVSQIRECWHVEPGEGRGSWPSPNAAVSMSVPIQYAFPESHAIPDGDNHGTLVVFNLDPEISSSSFRKIFEAYGLVKELRSTPCKKQQRFVEFHDARDAAKALQGMNGKEINGRQVVVEFSRPGGITKKLVDFPAAIKSSGDPSEAKSSQPFRYQSQAQTVADKYPLKSKSHHDVSAVESSMESLRLNNPSHGKVTSKRIDHNNKFAIDQGTKQWDRSRTTAKASKNKQRNKHDALFLISEEAMVDRRDPRTTVMIKNIPNKYSQKLLLSMLDNHCINSNEQIGDCGGDDQPFSSYDFVYLPIDFNNKCNVGYGFVNMTSPQAAWRLYKAFHNQHWEVFNSKKICQVTYARVQSLEALKEHFKNSKFPCGTDGYLPVVFSPPRDGRCLSKPIAIVDYKADVGFGGFLPGHGKFDGPDRHACRSCQASHDGASSDDGDRGSGCHSDIISA